MRVSRRSLVLLSFAGFALGRREKSHIRERRVYDAGSLLPPRAILTRNGIETLSIRHTEAGAEYTMTFASLESRAHAWDRFNTDPDWGRLRQSGEVRLREMTLDTV